MRRFLYKISLFLGLQALLMVGLGLRYPPEPGTYYAATCLKHERLASVSSPRIILVGGSGLTFGTCSNILEAGLHHPTVNMSLHADLGLPFMLNEVAPSVQPGDIIVVSCEYEHFFGDQTSWDRALLPVLEQRPASIVYLELGQLKDLSDNALGFVGNRCRQWLRYLRGKQRRASSRPYTLDSFNPYGDVIAHYAMSPTDSRNEAWGIETDLTDEALRTATERLNGFVAHCRNKQASVFFAFPATTSAVFTDMKSQIGRIEEYLAETLDCPILDTPDEVAWPSEFFFNSKYHLNQRGAERRTNHLLLRLSEHLNGTEKEKSRNSSQPARPTDGM